MRTLQASRRDGWSADERRAGHGRAWRAGRRVAEGCCSRPAASGQPAEADARPSQPYVSVLWGFWVFQGLMGNG